MARAADEGAGAILPRTANARRTGLSSAARGLALAVLIVSLACAAYASQALHTGVRLLDPLVGVALVLLALGLVHAVLRLASALLARLLGMLARHLPAHAVRALGAILPPLRLAGRPMTATTLGVALLMWGTPESGPLGVVHGLYYFEIPIVGAALAGLLAGAGLAWSRLAASPAQRRRVAVAALLPWLLVGGTVGAWAVLPGLGDPLVREDPAVPPTIAPLDVPDPSQPGTYRVVTASYGSGADARRPEYGADATWRTPTIDASAALPAHDSLTDSYERCYWGFDTAHLPLNALVWYPADAAGPLPLVLIVHGNHDAEDYSDPGYAYLGEHLASHGMIAASVDENFLNGDALFDYAGLEMPVRAWMLLRHADLFGGWNAQPGHPLAGRVDLQRIALVGHSRGGE